MVVTSATVHAINEYAVNEGEPVAIYDGLNEEVEESELNKKRLEIKHRFKSSLKEETVKYQDDQLEVLFWTRK